MGVNGLVKEKRWYMGNLPCPMPADYKHRHSHLIFAIKHGKDVAWIVGEIAKLRKWSESKGVLRLSWDGQLTKWLQKAILLEQEREAGRRAYGSTVVLHNGHCADSSNHSLGGIGDISVKVATYHKFLQANERMAAEYLERQPERVRRAILESCGASS